MSPGDPQADKALSPACDALENQDLAEEVRSLGTCSLRVTTTVPLLVPLFVTQMPGGKYSSSATRSHCDILCCHRPNMKSLVTLDQDLGNRGQNKPPLTAQ